MPSNIVTPMQWWDYNRDDPLARDLVGLWPFWEGMGGEVKDPVNGNHGTLTNMNPATAWVPTERGWALDFDTSESTYVDLNINAYDLGIRRHATFAIWCKLDDFDTFRHLFSDYNNANGFSLRFDPTNYVIFYVYPDNYRISRSFNIVANVWYHVVGVMDGTSIYLYINGQYLATSALGGDIGSSASTIKIGQRGDLNGMSSQGFEGPIPEAVIWKRALALSEIQDLYHNPNALLQPRARIPALPVVGISVPVVQHHRQQQGTAA